MESCDSQHSHHSRKTNDSVSSLAYIIVMYNEQIQIRTYKKAPNILAMTSIALIYIQMTMTVQTLSSN